MLETVAMGRWLTRQRVRAYCRIFLAIAVLAILALLATSDGGRDYAGRPLGTDFANVWSAGRLTLDGQAANAYSPALHYARQQAIFGTDIPFYGWHYPPFYLLIASLLALLPYSIALFTLMAATLPLYCAVIRKIMPDPDTLLVALAFPAVFINIGHGQNGFLTAALIGGGLLLLDRRPLLAGVCFGLLAYKPQFGIFIPLALLAGGYWRAIAGATATVLTLVAVATLVYGLEIWGAFAASTEFTRNIVLEQGNTGWEKIQSLFAATRAIGLNVNTAYAAQFLLVIGMVPCIWALWRGAVAFELKAAGLVIASLLATPYLLDYDLVVLGLPVAWLAAHGLRNGFLRWEKSLLAFAVVVPLLTRSVATYTHIPLGLMAMAAIAALIAAHAWPSTHQRVISQETPHAGT